MLPFLLLLLLCTLHLWPQTTAVPIRLASVVGLTKDVGLIQDRASQCSCSHFLRDSRSHDYQAKKRNVILMRSLNFV